MTSRQHFDLRVGYIYVNFDLPFFGTNPTFTAKICAKLDDIQTKLLPNPSFQMICFNMLDIWVHMGITTEPCHPRIQDAINVNGK